MSSSLLSVPSIVVTPEALLHQLRWRYATKKFDPTRKISPKDWDTLEEALVLSPSSFGLQPWKFFVITSPEIRQKLKSASWNQSQIVDASHLVVFSTKKDLQAADVKLFIAQIAKVRQVSVDSLKGYEGMMVGFVSKAAQGFDINGWAARQAYIALGNFLTSAAMLGIDACPMEGLEPAQYDAILGLDKKGYQTRMVATAGYRAADDAYATQAKVRFDRKDVIEHI